MNRVICEMLESRQLLSATLPESASLLAFSEAPSLAVTAKAQTRVANVVGAYVASVTFEQKAGRFTLKITSQKSGKLAGLLYSSDFGGFQVNVTGSIATNNKITLSGRNSTFTLKKFSAQASTDGKSLSGSCSIVQMGISVTGTFTAKKSAKAVAGPAKAKAPNLVGKYSGTSTGGDTPESITVTFTKQDGGHIWGRAQNGESLTGVVLPNGEFRLIEPSSDGHSDIFGKRQSDGSLTGEWKWTGKNRDTDHGTFSLSRA